MALSRRALTLELLRAVAFGATVLTGVLGLRSAFGSDRRPSPSNASHGSHANGSHANGSHANGPHANGSNANGSNASHASNASPANRQPPPLRATDPSGKPVLLSSRCPHLGCTVHRTPDGSSFACPCHGSRFDAHGRRLAGPALADLEPQS